MESPSTSEHPSRSSYLDISKLESPEESEIYVLRQLEQDGILFLQHLYQYCREKALIPSVGSLITLYLRGQLLGEPFPQLDCFQTWNLDFSFTLQVECLTWLESLLDDDTPWAAPLIRLLLTASEQLETVLLLSQCVGWLRQPFIRKILRRPEWWKVGHYQFGDPPLRDYHLGRQKIEDYTTTCWGLLLLHPFRHQNFEEINWELSFQWCELLMKDSQIRPLLLNGLTQFVEQFQIYTQTTHVLQMTDQLSLALVSPQCSKTITHMQLGYATFQIMLRFWEKARNIEKLKQIPVSHLADCYHGLDFSGAEQGCDNTNGSPIPFMERCFFLAHRTFQTCYASYLDLIKEAGKRTILWQQSIEELDANNTDDLVENLLKIKIAQLRQRIKPMHVCLQSCLLANRLTYLMEDTAYWLWSHREERLPTPIIEEIVQYVNCYQRSILSSEGSMVVRFPQCFSPPSRSISNIVSLWLEIIGHRHLCANPHIRMEILDFIEFLVINPSPRSREEPQSIHIRHLRREERLIPHLIQFGVGIEETGDHNQFYQKFHPRYQICGIILYLWLHPDFSLYYGEEILRVSQRDFKLWERFVFLLLNDYNYVLDEALTSLNKIHERDKSPHRAADHPEEAEQERGNEKVIRSYLIYAREYLLFLNQLAHANPEVFTKPEVMGKWVQIFLFYFQKLTGSGSRKYKVKDMDKYQFEPLLLVQNMADVFTIFQDWGAAGQQMDALIPTMIADGRFSISVFDSVTSLLRHKKCFGNKLWSKLSKLEQIRKRLQVYKSQHVDYDEYSPPEELCDPILNTLIREPVLLPTSKMMVDKSMIQKHLMSDRHDPFNRDILTLEGIETHNSLPEIKVQVEEFTQKIERWKQDLKITSSDSE